MTSAQQSDVWVFCYLGFTVPFPGAVLVQKSWVNRDVSNNTHQGSVRSGQNSHGADLEPVGLLGRFCHPELNLTLLPYCP